MPRTPTHAIVPGTMLAETAKSWTTPPNASDRPLLAFDLAKAYLKHNHTDAILVDTDTTFWAVDLLYTLCDQRPDIALLVIEHAVAQATKVSDLGIIAAGPLEDLISCHPEKMIKDIEDMARQSRRFRLTLQAFGPKAKNTPTSGIGFCGHVPAHRH